jgi:phenylacetate-CoA ligase
LEGSVLSRLDDMKKIRGVIVYPSKIEELVRGFKEVEEFQILFKRIEGLDEIFVRIEPVPAMSPSSNPALKEKASKELHLELGIRVSVELVGQGVLPRWDHKAKRVIDERKDIPF